MRKLVENSLLCFLSLVIFGTNEGVAQILLKDYDLIGKVKEMRQYHYIPLEDCDYCEDLKNDSILATFDLNGKATKRIEWNTGTYSKGIKNANKAILTYKYDDGKISIIETNVDNDGFYKKQYIRDNRGYIVREETYLQRTDKWWHEYWWGTYRVIYGGDEQKLLNAKDYVEGQIKKEIEKSKKEDDGLVEVVYRKNNDNGTGKELSTYKCYGIDKTKTLCKRVFCDDNGWYIKTTTYNGDETSEITYSREFYTSGKVAKSTVIYSNGNKEITTYNEKGLCTSLTKYYKNEKVGTVTYSYNYDNFGNWITKKTNENGRLINIYKRKITYYK